MNGTPPLSVTCRPELQRAAGGTQDNPVSCFGESLPCCSGQRRHEITTMCSRKRLERDGEGLKKKAEAQTSTETIIQSSGPGTKTLMVLLTRLRFSPRPEPGVGRWGENTAFSFMFDFPTKAHCSSLSQFISKVCFLK